MLVPNVSYGSKTNQKIESIDEAEKIIQTKTSDLQIDTKLPEKKIAVIIKETPPEEIVKEKAIKDVLLDVVKNDVIIPKNDILPADEVGISPKLRTQQEIIVEPKPRGLRRIFGNRNRLGDDIRPDVFGTDGIETGIREIIE
jgi:hypothetical protein